MEKQTTQKPSKLSKILKASVYKNVLVYNINIKSYMLSTRDKETFPETLALLETPQGKKLFLGHVQIPDNRWKLDKKTKVLTLKHQRGKRLFNARFEMPFQDADKGYGFLSINNTNASVELDVQPVAYNCNISVDAGQGSKPAVYATGKAGNVTLHWDTSSSKWTSATWIKNALKFSFGIEEKIFIGQKTDKIVVSFEDLSSSQQWNPDEGEFSLLLDTDLNLDFSLGAEDTPPTSDATPKSSKDPQTVFPYNLSLNLDVVGATFDGAMLVGEQSTLGDVYAIHGEVVNPSILGVYHTQDQQGNEVKIRVANGKLVLNNHTPVNNSFVRGNKLHWKGISAKAMKQSGLPAQGFVKFSPDGSTIVNGSHVSQGKRKLQEINDASPATNQVTTDTQVSSSDLNVSTLMNMSQFEQDGDGKWFDAIQQNSMANFFQIIQNYTSSDLKKEFFPSFEGLSSDIKGISEEKGLNGTDPKDWYKDLSIAYLTQALSGVDDDDAKKLNALRAQKFMKTQTGNSDVFQAQAPDLYQLEWMKKWPETQDFLDDQKDKDNQSKYNGFIDQDKDAWKKQMEDFIQDDPDTLKDILKEIDDAADKGKKELYWAYLFFRYITQPSALNLLRTLAFEGDLSSGGSAYIRTIQKETAVLNALDSSGFFVQQYMQVIQTFQIGDILPTLFDYSGNIDEYEFGVQEILTAYIKKFANSDDPAIQKAVQQLEEAQQEGQVRDILEAFASLASEFTGIYNWDQLAAKFESKLPSILSKIPAVVSNLVSLAAYGMGATSFIYGVMDWKNLDATERAEMVEGSVGFFAQIVASFVTRGVKYTEIFKAENGIWQGVKAIGKSLWSSAEVRGSNGFARWVLGENGIENVEEASALLGEASEEATQEITIVTKVFGKNLDVFMATRIGAVLSIANLVFSSIALAQAIKDGDTTEEIADGILVGSAALQVIASVGGLAADLAGVSEAVILGVAELATILSVIGAVAGLVAIAGIVILLVIGFKKPESPVKEFAKNQAKDAGFYMPKKAEIDYLQVFQVKGETQRIGLAMEFKGDTSQVLTFKTDGSIKLSSQSDDYPTAFFMSTDYRGYATFSTLLTKDDEQKLFTLTLDDDDKSDDPRVSGNTSVFTDDAAKQQWIGEIQGGVSHDSEDNLEKADFYLYNAYYKDKKDKKYYLVGDSDGKVKVSTTPQSWTLEMVVMQPAGLTMNDIELFTFQMGQTFSPRLDQPGSAPHTWSIDPDLPDFMELDSDNGKISQKGGEKPDEMDSKEYTLEVKNDVGSASVKFKMQVTKKSFDDD